MGFRLCSYLLIAAIGSLASNNRVTAQMLEHGGGVRRLQSLELGRQNAQYQECVDNMYASDFTGDLALSEQEYLLFIAKESQGEILVEDFSELPFPLVTHFIYGACFCSIIFQTPNCCVGAQAAIDLNPENSPFVIDNLITICISVAQVIGEEVPTDLPALLPSAAPSQSPSTAPTKVTSEEPSLSPTIAPTTLAPSVPTQRPTPEELTCVNFQYGISNSDGFTAEDIFNEIGNTLKTGLIIATRNVTIETLNTTFPRDESGRRLQQQLQRNHWPLESSKSVDAFLAFRPYDRYITHDIVSAANSGTTTQVTDLGRFRLGDEVAKVEPTPMAEGIDYQHTQGHRRAAYLPIGAFDEDARRLSFYTDEFEPLVNSIFENPFCDTGIQCMIVDSTVCVLLEEGDDETMVRAALLGGIEQSIRDGSFQAAIPPENQLPSGEDVVDSP
ncbi:hypothetical protein IV203_009818 [Nitzschia inconspicua]|uniref:Uncharacterized protein n=1 Tax=Nitzschia inconspicua TaxID=303405 RepID=A0A9K3PKE8_9STRA|nr:hypothetical protein IV203_009818 [Nitzschia inconspicua]